MSEFIDFVPIESENKHKNNPYEVRDIRVSILEELVIVMSLISLVINTHEAGYAFNMVLWIVAMILSVIECVKIWKRNKKNV